MMSVWHLVWIIPMACLFGFIIAALLSIGDG